MIHALQHILGICGDSPTHVSLVGLMASVDGIPWLGMFTAFLRDKFRRSR